ncbi:right-handed parallel beta-helix repeat-containing protein [Candidatus Woesearchaeota archaeon]|nr:right-handed parallel beta-helix repeat-containing protein [Candidatus Woesearchaeota archaeon]
MNNKGAYGRNVLTMLILSLVLILSFVMGVPTSTTPSTNVSIINPDEDIKFSVSFTTEATEPQSLFVCRDSSCTSCSDTETSGCLCTDVIGTSPRDCVYTGTTEDPSSNNWYYRMKNSTDSWTDILSGGSFTVNHPPYATSVAVTPTSVTNASTLTCGYTYGDPESHSEDGSLTEYTWYWDPDGPGPLGNLTYTSFDSTVVHQEVPFNVDDYVFCGVVVYDDYQYTNNTVYTSGPVTIEGNHPINIISVTDNSNSSLPTNEGSDVTFEVAWNDSDSSEIAEMIVCSSNIHQNKQCVEKTFCNVSQQTSSPMSCSYTVEASDNEISTYYVIIFDNGSSDSMQGDNFYVNHKPTVSYLEDLTSDIPTGDGAYNYTDSANLYCNVTGTYDQNGDDVSYTILWEVNRSGITYNYSMANTSVMTHGNTIPGDFWRCTITAKDYNVTGNPVSTTWALISYDDGYGYTNPFLINYSTDANITNPVNVGDFVTFTINWDDLSMDPDEVSIYICNSSRIEKSGCVEKIFNESRTITSKSVSVKYQALESDLNENHEIGYWISICNHRGGTGGDWSCSNFNTELPSEPMGKFSVNHLPKVDSIILVPETEADNETNLVCSVSASDNANDYYKDLNISYEWYRDQGSGFSLYYTTNTSNTLTHANTHNLDVWKCKATPFDGYTLGNSIESNHVTIIGYPFELPILSSIFDDSDTLNRTLPANYISFEMDWFHGRTGELVYGYICNSSRIDVTGCMDFEYARAQGTASPLQLTYLTQESNTGSTTYYAKICDSSGQCTNTTTGDLFFNHRGRVYNANITSSGSDFTELDNLYCDTDYSATDIDGDTVTIRYLWYKSTTGTDLYSGDWLNSNKVIYEADDNNILTHGMISDGDYLMCEAYPYDTHNLYISGRTPEQNNYSVEGYKDGHYSRSQMIYVRSVEPAPPVVHSIKDNSNSTQRLRYGEELKIEINWTDINGDDIIVYVCNSTQIYLSGCFGKEYARTISGSSPLTISYPLEINDSGKMDYYVYIMDENLNYSGTYPGSFYANHNPQIDVITVLSSETSFSSTSNLECSVSQTYDLDHDPVSIYYGWETNRTGSFLDYGTISRYLTHGNTMKGDYWRCYGIPTDQYSNGTKVFSQPVLIVSESETVTLDPIIMSITGQGLTFDNPVNEDQVFTYALNISDSDSTEIKYYFCDSPNIVENGCFDSEYIHDHTTIVPGQVNSIVDSFSVQNLNSSENYIWAMACDVEHHCSENYPTSFYVNHKPYPGDIEIYNPNITTNNVLTCNYEYRSGDVGLLDTEATDYAQYKWYAKPLDSDYTMIPANNKSITTSDYNISRNTSFICSVKVTDVFGLSTPYFTNSTEITIGNTQPNISVTLYPEFPDPEQDLICYYSLSDQDGDPLDLSIKWYRNGLWLQGPTSEVLYSSWLSSAGVEIGDNFTCELTASDGDETVSAMSNQVTLVEDAKMARDLNGPNITSLYTPEVYNYNGTLTIQIDWIDPHQADGEIVSAFVCDLDIITSNGCAGDAVTICEVTTSNETISCTGESWTSENNHTYYVKLCDDTGYCSDIISDSFYMNYAPIANNVQIFPSEPNNDTLLLCDFAYEDDEPWYDNQFKWYRRATQLDSYSLILGETDSNLSNSDNVVFYNGDQIKCAVLVTDSYGLSDTQYRESDPVQVSDNSTFTCPSISSNQVITESMTLCYMESFNATNITITGNDITIECNDSTIVSNEMETGLIIIDSDNVNVTNCHITNQHNGVQVIDSSRVSIDSNYIYNNSDYNLINNYEGNISADMVYWGYDNQEEINEKLFDHNDNDSYGYILYDNYIDTSGQVIYDPHDENKTEFVCPNVTDAMVIRSSFTMCEDQEYHLTNGLFINGRDIILDCNGSTIEYSGSGIGLYLYDNNNVTIIDCNIKGYQYGIYLISNNSNININNNTLQNNTDYNIFNYQDTDITANYNYWGYDNQSGINQYLYDYYDNESSGRILYTHYINSSGHVVYDPHDEVPTGYGDTFSVSGSSPLIMKGGSGGSAFIVAIDNSTNSPEINTDIAQKDIIEPSDDTSDQEQYLSTEQAEEILSQAIDTEQNKFTGAVIGLKDINVHVANLLVLTFIALISSFIITYKSSIKKKVQSTKDQEKLSDYIEHMIRNRHPPRTIYEILLKNGWDKKTAKQHIISKIKMIKEGQK